ncbi:hypothetical protein FVR03_06010 [Pontibacter qinzhouensis]|uniref:Uncharacterized protein n=1 Tax=Pontibacter qinzhouensis TaxID=2603253 RepID=A0A5C8KAR1_9BACT|nr:hypothetical protein [Pontibacter qinzhouensis]TXK49644.1 hypothetical protein FVR03_06010 [Pontibacter qinzhouensis]
MKRVRIPVSVIVAAYGCILLLLAAVFLMRDQTLTSMHKALPVYFLMRFCMFWFISFVLAIVFYLANLNLNYMGIPSIQKKHSLQIGTLALGAGSVFVLIALLLITYFQF